MFSRYGDGYLGQHSRLGAFRVRTIFTYFKYLRRSVLSKSKRSLELIIRIMKQLSPLTALLESDKSDQSYKIKQTHDSLSGFATFHLNSRYGQLID